jgi:hypothetical protein
MPTALEALSGYEDRSGLTERVSGEKRGRRTAESSRAGNGTVRPLSSEGNNERWNWIPDRTDPDVAGLSRANALPQAGRTGIRIGVGLKGLDYYARVGSLAGLLAGARRRDDVERLHEDRDQHVRQTSRNEDPAPALGARMYQHYWSRFGALSGTSFGGCLTSHGTTTNSVTSIIPITIQTSIDQLPRSAILCRRRFDPRLVLGARGESFISDHGKAKT